MIIKRGNVVSHAVAVEWGVGKVMEVTDTCATIEFASGIVRKVVASHYKSLVPADPALFVPMPPSIPAVKLRTTASTVKKAKKTAP